jgi:hypothetical protein
LAAAPRGKGSPENTHHRYRGVRQCKSGRWASEIREPNHGKRHWLGTFNTAVDAAIAYDTAAIAYFGSRAIVNIGSRVIPWYSVYKIHFLLTTTSVSMNNAHTYFKMNFD